MNFKNIFSSLVFILIILFEYGNTAKILFFFGLSTYSHRILVWPLIEELVKLGHEVTYFSSSPNKHPHPKVKDFVPSGLTEFYKGDGIMNTNLLHAKLEGRLFSMWNKMPEFGELICDIILKSPDTKVWANSSSFDLVFIDALFNDCGFAFVHKFKAKHILFGTTIIFTWDYDHNGIIPETSWIPEFIHHFPAAENMNFLHRVVSTVETIRWHLVRQYIYLPNIENIIRTQLDLHDMPSISEMEKNVSLFFTNTHFSDEYARSIPPFVVPIGGLHLTESANISTIPNSILKFIGDADSFIYVSFGGDAKISTLPKPKLDAMFNSFKNINLPIIWRWDDKLPKDLPKNILMIKWLPQQALLAHPKLKLMVSHGGILGIHEALHNNVPLIVMPIFAEQAFNAERVQRKGFGIHLDFCDLTEENFTVTLQNILQNPSYKEATAEVARFFRDRINTPLETALWYTQYVLRNDHTSYLKPYSMKQCWYERRLLDVWIFLFTITLAIFLLAIYAIKFLATFCFKMLTNLKIERKLKRH